MSVLGHMRSCLLLLIVIGLAAIFLIKTLSTTNPMKTALESVDMVAPAAIDYRAEEGWFGIGMFEYVTLANKSDKTLVIKSANIIRADGKVETLHGVPDLVQPATSIESRIRDGLRTYILKAGDRIEVSFEGYPIPTRLRFN